MAQAKYTIYKYVRSERGSRFGSVRVALKSHPALSQTRTAERHSTPIAHQARCRGGRRREKNIRRATTISRAAENGFLSKLTH